MSSREKEKPVTGSRVQKPPRDIGHGAYERVGTHRQPDLATEAPPELRSIRSWPGGARTAQNHRRPKTLGLLAGKYTLPDEFFDDLSEQELQAWNAGSPD